MSLTPTLAPATIDIEKVFKPELKTRKEELNEASGLAVEVSHLLEKDSKQRRASPNLIEPEQKNLKIIKEVINSLSDSISKLQAEKALSQRLTVFMTTSAIAKLIEFKALDEWLKDIPTNTPISKNAESLRKHLENLHRTLAGERPADLTKDLMLKFGDVFNELFLIRLALADRKNSLLAK